MLESRYVSGHTFSILYNHKEVKMMKVDDKVLQDWLLANEPEDKMLWKEHWWKNNCFIRDRILNLFPDGYEVVGSHYSKSIECPVVKTIYKGVEILWQYNFYYWQIMVKSNRELELTNLELINADSDYFYYQGIPHEYAFKQYSEENKKEFAICICAGNSNYLDVWAFAIKIREAIDKEVE